MGNEQGNLNSEEIARGRRTINQLQASLESQRNQLFVKTHEIATIKNQLEEFRNDYRILERAFSERTGVLYVKEEFEKLESDILALQANKSTISLDIGDLHDKKRAMTAQIDKLQDEKANISNVIVDLEKQVKDKLHTIDEMVQKCSDDILMGVWSPKTLTYTITSQTPSAANLITDCNLNEFNIVKELFMKTTQKHFQVHKVQKINNPHLRAMRLLREKEHQILHGKTNVKQMLYRGFKMSRHELAEIGFIQTIQKYGFIKFSKVSNHECHKSQIIDEWKCMVVSSVIVCDRCESKPPTPISNSADYGKRRPTSVNIYREDMVYPEYLIYFTGETIIKPNDYVNSSTVNSTDRI